MSSPDDGSTALTAALVAARRGARMTQRELARRLGRARSYIAKIEKGRRHLTVTEFAQLAGALGIDPRDLLAKILKLNGRDGVSESRGLEKEAPA